MSAQHIEWKARKTTVVLVFAWVIVACLVDRAVAGDFRVRLQLSYVSGLEDLADQYEDNIEVAESEVFDIVDVDTFVWPVGISLFPYYQWDNGLMVGAGIGPFMYLIAEGYVEDDYDHWQVPLSACVGYVFGPDNPVSFYVRAGLSYHLADGDFYDGSNLGFIGAAGLEFLRRDNIILGVEAAYDSAEVDIDDLRNGGTEGIKAAEFSVGMFVTFK